MTMPLSFIKKLLSQNLKNFLTYYNLGLLYQSLGEFDKAKFYFEKVTELNPQFTNADKILSRFTKYKKGDNHIENMKLRLKKLDLTDYNKSNILFALGKAYEDIEDYENSFKVLDEANNLQKKSLSMISKMMKTCLKK